MRATDPPPGAGAEPESSRGARGMHAYATIVVVGGGCYGSYYVRQIRRASDAGALSYERLVVVDRDADCRVARETATAGAATAGPATPEPAEGGPPHRDVTAALAHAPYRSAAPSVEVAEWEEFFRAYLGREADGPPNAARDAIVPSPLMPHLMYDWLLERARARWPGRAVRTLPLDRAPSTPWQRGSESGTHFVSFAEWMCPINCVEPALCPEIRGPRSWSMPAAIRAYVEAERERGRPLAGPLLMRCLHRAYGVGMFDTSEVLAADAELARAGAAGPVRVLVGTVSHCHGALNVVEVGAER